jgi:hypothetical protein
MILGICSYMWNIGVVAYMELHGLYTWTINQLLSEMQVVHHNSLQVLDFLSQPETEHLLNTTCSNGAPESNDLDPQNVFFPISQHFSEPFLGIPHDQWLILMGYIYIYPSYRWFPQQPPSIVALPRFSYDFPSFNWLYLVQNCKVPKFPFHNASWWDDLLSAQMGPLRADYGWKWWIWWGKMGIQWDLTPTKM